MSDFFKEKIYPSSLFMTRIHVKDGCLSITRKDDDGNIIESIHLSGPDVMDDLIDAAHTAMDNYYNE